MEGVGDGGVGGGGRASQTLLALERMPLLQTGWSINIIVLEEWSLKTD